MTSGSTHGPLEVALSRSHFSQAGSWSMFDIAKAPLQISLGMLSRYAAGRVNTHTMVVAELMGKTFVMGRNGRASVQQAFSKLSAVSTLGDSLFIGFGIEDFTREMVKSEAGAMQMALCAALKECYCDDIAVEVLLEYARKTKADGKWMPSNMEWRNLLDACAGCLAASNFALRAEHLMHLMRDAKDERPLGAYVRGGGMPKNMRGCSAPKSIADALYALASLSRGHMTSICLRGGPDAGWLAAVAEYFLDLNVKIVDDKSKEPIYRNHENDRDTQVTVVYLGQRQQAPENTSSNERHVELHDKTYEVTLEDLSKFFQVDALDNPHVVSGRIPWDSALRLAFGSDFARLKATPNALGTMIGSAAVLFKTMAQAHQSFPTKYLLSNSGYSDMSHGQGFVASVIHWFPELEDLRNFMHRSLNVSCNEASREYDSSVAILGASCDCIDCRSYGEQVDSKPVQYCLIVIAETIIRICRNLSNLVVHGPELQPIRSGFEVTYWRCKRLHHRSTRHSQAFADLGQFAYCIEVDNDFNTNELEGYGAAIETKMCALLELYTGRKCGLYRSTSALSGNGLSAFFSVLTPSHNETNGHVGQVHLIPGRITFQGKSYKELADRVMEKIDDFTMTDGSFKRSDYNLTSEDGSAHRSISVREGPKQLQCLMNFTRNDGVETGFPSLNVGPSALGAVLARRRGLVPCEFSRTGRECRSSFKASGKPYDITGKWVEHTHNGKSIIIMRPSQGMQVLSTLAFLTSSWSQCWTYIVDEQCESCCIRTAIAHEDPANLEDPGEPTDLEESEDAQKPKRNMFCFVYIE